MLLEARPVLLLIVDRNLYHFKILVKFFKYFFEFSVVHYYIIGTLALHGK